MKITWKVFWACLCWCIFGAQSLLLQNSTGNYIDDLQVNSELVVDAVSFSSVVDRVQSLEESLTERFTTLEAKLSDVDDLLSQQSKELCECYLKDVDAIFIERFGSSCYAIFPPKSWAEANETCNSYLTHLVTIETAEENTFLGGFVARYQDKFPDSIYFYMGLYDYGDENYAWVTDPSVIVWSGRIDGTSPNGLYTNWRVGGEPNNPLERCGTVFTSGKWNDLECSRKMPYVCEREFSS